MKVIVYLSILFQCGLYATIDVQKIRPREQAVINLTADDVPVSKEVLESLDQLIAGRRSKINYITPREARTYFEEYLIEKMGPEKAQQAIRSYFNKNYFGKQPAPELDIFSIAKADPYLGTNIFNALRQPEAHKKSMQPHRWNPAVRLISPEQAYQIFLGEPSWLANQLKKEGLNTLEKYREKYPEKAEEIFSEEFFGIPKDSTHASFGILTPELIENIYMVAQRILQQTSRGDYILFFGNSPYFVGRAVQLLASKNKSDANYRTIILFPFSGSPNKTRPGSTLKYEDIVTVERLNHLKKRMEKAGLSPSNQDLLNKKLYIVDVIASGGGPAYMLEELIRKFQEAGKKIPDTTIMALNKIDINDPDDRRNATIAKRSAGDNEAVTFFFPSIKNTDFAVSGKVIFLPGHGNLDMLPTMHWRVLPEYNASYWVPEYDHLLEKRSEIIKHALNYFDASIEKLKNDKK